MTQAKGFPLKAHVTLIQFLHHYTTTHENDSLLHSYGHTDHDDNAIYFTIDRSHFQQQKITENPKANQTIYSTREKTIKLESGATLSKFPRD